MIYILATLLSILFATVAVGIQNGRVKAHHRIWSFRWWAFLSFVPLAVVSSIRFGVGTDFYIYYNAYRQSISWEYLEMAFRYLLLLLNSISSNPQLFFIFSSLWICGSYFYRIYKESVNPIYSILLFVLVRDYFRSMNVVRQYMALGLCLFALSYIKEKDWKRAIPIIAIACVFHTSAIIYFLLFFLYVIDIKPYMVLIGTTLVFFYGEYIKEFLFPFIVKYTHYAKFFSSSFFYSKSQLEVTTLLVYLAFIILLTYEYRMVKKNNNLKLLYTALLVAAMVVVSGVVMPLNVTRFAWYMNPIIALYVPEAVQSLPDKRMSIGINWAIIICYLLITVTGTLQGSNDVLPYQTFWDIT